MVGNLNPPPDNVEGNVIEPPERNDGASAFAFLAVVLSVLSTVVLAAVAVSLNSENGLNEPVEDVRGLGLNCGTLKPALVGSVVAGFSGVNRGVLSRLTLNSPVWGKIMVGMVSNENGLLAALSWPNEKPDTVLTAVSVVVV